MKHISRREFLKASAMTVAAGLAASAGCRARGAPPSMREEVEREAFMRPQVFELKVGEAISLSAPDGPRRVTLLGVTHEYQPDLWVADNPAKKTISAALVRVDVSGEERVLVARPFQLPTTVNGLQLYVETTREWAISGKVDALRDVTGDVRLSALPAGRPWAPPDCSFPVRDYRWRSATYNNTWLALVPYNLLYYHHGEDLGAIPDRLSVVAVEDGIVAQSPLPAGDGRSNSLVIRTADGLAWRYAHMNVETIDPALTPGAAVKAGRLLGKTGCTWGGKRSQTTDPHLHVALSREKSELSAYPFLVQAYFNSYPDSVLAAAGGYAFALPGGEVALDASRSVARPGRSIASVQWRLHDGRVTNDPRVALPAPAPGLYSEELIVRADDGFESRDFAQVRVFDPARGKEMATGWVYHTPLRGIRPGAPVLFWNRLRRMQGPVQVDFGDGAPAREIGDEIEHSYDRPGLYTAAFTGRGPADEPVTVKTPVVVE